MGIRTSFNRRTATKVKDGRVQRKNRHTPTTHLGYIIDRESPGRGYRHVVTKRDIQTFLDLIPEWPALSQRLERIVLAARSDDLDGFAEFYYREGTGAIFLNAWSENLWVRLRRPYFDQHRFIFERFGLSFDLGNEAVECRFTDSQARAFVLLHIFMHELGHHRERLSKKHRTSCIGETYAERFANRYLDVLYPAYVRVFGDPTRES